MTIYKTNLQLQTSENFCVRKSITQQVLKSHAIFLKLVRLSFRKVLRINFQKGVRKL